MNNSLDQVKKDASLTQDSNLRHLFLSLKRAALGILCIGIMLIVVLYLWQLPKLSEFFILLIFGVTSAGFIIARTRTIVDYAAQQKRHLMSLEQCNRVPQQHESQ